MKITSEIKVDSNKEFNLTWDDIIENAGIYQSDDCEGEGVRLIVNESGECFYCYNGGFQIADEELWKNDKFREVKEVITISFNNAK